LNNINDIKNLFLHPVVFFEELASRDEKSYILPMALVIILSVISAIIVKNLYMDYYTVISTNMGNASAGELARDIEVQGIVSILVSGLAPMIVIFVKSYLVNGIASFGGFGKIRDSLTTISWSYLPAVSGTFLASIAAVVLGQYGFEFSPGSIMELFGETSAASMILKGFDIFVIWYEILAIVGISKIYRVSYSKASVFILGTWFSWMLISAGFALMTI